MIKKINAVLALLGCMLFTIHAVYQAVSYILFYYNPILTKVLAWSLAGIIIMHAVLSAASVFVLHDSKTIAYKRLNIGTTFQRISAAVMTILLPLHIFSFSLLGKVAGTWLYIVAEALQVLFLLAAFGHGAVSFSKALITLGLLEDDGKRKNIDRAAAIAAGIMFVAVSVIITVTHSKLFAGN